MQLQINHQHQKALPWRDNCDRGPKRAKNPIIKRSPFPVSVVKWDKNRRARRVSRGRRGPKLQRALGKGATRYSIKRSKIRSKIKIKIRRLIWLLKGIGRKNNMMIIMMKRMTVILMTQKRTTSKHNVLMWRVKRGEEAETVRSRPRKPRRLTRIS